MKKFVSMLLAILMVFSVTTASTNAMTTNTNQTTQTTEIEVPILTIPENFSEDEAIAYAIDNGARGLFPGVATYALIRNPSRPDKCQLFINWSGELANGFRCKKVAIKSTDLLFPKTYDTSGDGVTYRQRVFVASTKASVFYEQYDVPANVTSATVYITSAQIYILSSAHWVSAAKNNYTTTIKK